jgi:hypothetical protein
LLAPGRHHASAAGGGSARPLWLKIPVWWLSQNPHSKPPVKDLAALSVAVSLPLPPPLYFSLPRLSVSLQPRPLPLRSELSSSLPPPPYPASPTNGAVHVSDPCGYRRNDPLLPPQYLQRFGLDRILSVRCQVSAICDEGFSGSRGSVTRRDPHPLVGFGFRVSGFGFTPWRRRRASSITPDMLGTER